MQRDRQQYTSRSRPTNTTLTNLKQNGTNDAFPFVPQPSRIVPNNPSQSPFFNLYQPIANHYGGRRSISPTYIERSTHLTDKHDNNYANNHQQINIPRYMDPPHTPNSLKIPTTPTRSKSLSPSLRNVVQPPRMRHKQQVLDSVYTLNTTSQQTDKERQQQQQYNNNAAIASSSSCFSFSNNQNLHRLSTHGTNQYDKPYSDVNTQFEWKHADNRKPVKFSVNKSTKTDDSLKASHTSNKCTQVDKELDSPTKNPNIDDCSSNSVRFNLPFNMRSVNLKNFTTNQNSNSKRACSLTMKRMRNSLPSLNDEKCVAILTRNLQTYLNEEIKCLLDDYKKSYLEPAVNNLRRNNDKTLIENDDVLSLCDQLLDEAKTTLSSELKARLTKRKNSDCFFDETNDMKKAKLNNLQNDDNS